MPPPSTPKERILLRKAHQTLRRVTTDFETRWHFNSAIALIMELTNEIYRRSRWKKKCGRKFERKCWNC